MKIACLILALAAGLAAQPETSLQATRVNHALVLNEVFLNGTGPFRMMIDTGNASCLIRPRVAQRLKAHAAYAVDQVTLAGTRHMPVVVLNQVKAGAVTEQAVEAVVGETPMDGVDGVLGQSWLVRHDYLLDYRNRRLVLDGAPPQHGSRTALRSADGRPLVEADVDGRRTELVLDSGSAAVVLFETAGRVRSGATLLTNGGSAAGEEGYTRIVVAGDRTRRMNAVRVNAAQPSPGLLPASAFAAVFVSNRQGFVVLAR